MRAAIYARRSQKHQDASVTTQIEEATRFIASKGWELVETYPDDQKNTGRKEFVKRREFLRLLADAEESRFDIVVARDHTRLGGDTSRTMRAIEDLTEAGIEVWYYIENKRVTLTTAMDKIMFAVQSGTSEAERDGISSRVYESLMVRARKGVNVGGRCYGYANVPIIEGEKRVRTEYRVHEQQAAVVRDIMEMYAEGCGLRKIAVELNSRGIQSPSAGKRGIGLWTSSALYSIVRNERYRGVITYGRKRKTYRRGTKVRVSREPQELTRVEVPELRIVSDDLWLSVQAKIAENARKPWATAPGPKPKHMLTGLAVCGVCHRGIKAHRGKHGTQNVRVYMCKTHQELNACSNTLHRPADEIEEALIAELQSRVLDEAFVTGVMREVRTRLAERIKQSETDESPTLKAEAQKLRTEIANLAEAVASGGAGIPLLVQKMTERQGRLTSIEGRLAAIQHAPRAIHLESRRLEKEILASLSELRTVFAGQPADARKILESLLDGKLVMTPVETWRGKRYKVEGKANLGGMIQIPATLFTASPGGVEPPLAT